MSKFSEKRVAIVHYWLVGMRGGERVVENLVDMFPQADIFTHVYDPSAISAKLNGQTIKTTFIQRLPGSIRHYQKLLPLMPFALSELDLTGYDLVISSESGPAKGVIVSPTAQHICYCHSPMRYLWDHYHEYRRGAGRLSRGAMSLLFPALRQWDFQTAQSIDQIVANSSFIRQRIRRSWGRDSLVIAPPVPVNEFYVSADVSNEYLWVGQMTPYKRADLAVDTFNRLGLPLLMVGDGEMRKELMSRAKSNIRWAERLKFSELKDAYSKCKALIFTAEEDFGIVPLEASASGRPVIAYGRGGVLDTIIPGKTGFYFEEQTVDSLTASIEKFERSEGLVPAECVMNAHRFAPERFKENMAALVWT